MELYNNAAVYEPNKYTQEPITKDVKKYLLFLDFTERKILTYIVKRIEIESQDAYFSLGFQQSNYFFYSVEPQGFTSSPNPAFITIRMS